MMYDFSFVCQILARRKETNPPYTNKEIRDIMKHPMTLSELFFSRAVRIKDLAFWLSGILPPFLSVMLLRLYAHLLHRI
jgi:hypothetical protein